VKAIDLPATVSTPGFPIESPVTHHCFYAFTHTRFYAFTRFGCRFIACYSLLAAVFYDFFRISANGFAEMHGDAKRQMNENNELGLAWQMQLYIAGSK